MDRRRFVRMAGAVAGAASVPSALLSQEPERGQEGPSSRGQEDPRFLEVARLLEAKMAEYHVPGVALGVWKDGELAMRGFGITNLYNPQPVTPDTLFPIASISKTVTATAMMRLHDRGLVDIEAPVAQYLPDFRVASDGVTRGVRIWQLLTHTPGWEGQLGAFDLGPATLDNFVRALGDLPSLAAPGEVWGYNNTGWGVAGRVIEAVTDRWFNEALGDLVFGPLGLDRAITRTESAVIHSFAVGHREIDGEMLPIAFRLAPNVPAAGCAMSLENLMRYALFHLGDGTAPEGERLLAQGFLEAMRTSRLVKAPTTDEMGLGWHLRTLNGVQTVQHGGTGDGHCLHLELVPERGLCFAILTNSGGFTESSGGWRLNQDVASAILALYENLSLAPNQRSGGNRGGSERMDLHAEPLATQPRLEEFVGIYSRAPYGVVGARARAGRLLVGEGEAEVGVTFYAPDMAYATAAGPNVYVGMPIEFVRDATGEVRWIRVDGRIARRA